MSLQTYSTTYFKILSYHYLISSHATIDIVRLCYYTSNLFTGSGNRQQTFSNATTAKNGSYLTLTTVLSGMKLVNTNGTYLYLQAESHTNSPPAITTVIYTQDYNLVEWVCLAVIVYDPKTTLAG